MTRAEKKVVKQRLSALQLAEALGISREQEGVEAPPAGQRSTRGGRQSGSPGRLHERSESQRTDQGRTHRGHRAGGNSGVTNRHVRPDRCGSGCSWANVLVHQGRVRDMR